MCAESLAQACVASASDQGIGERMRVLLDDEKPFSPSTHELGQPADTGRDERLPRGHRLERDVRQAVDVPAEANRRHGDDVGRGHVYGDLARASAAACEARPSRRLRACARAPRARLGDRRRRRARGGAAERMRALPREPRRGSRSPSRRTRRPMPATTMCSSPKPSAAAHRLGGVRGDFESPDVGAVRDALEHARRSETRGALEKVVARCGHGCGAGEASSASLCPIARDRSETATSDPCRLMTSGIARRRDERADRPVRDDPVQRGRRRNRPAASSVARCPRRGCERRPARVRTAASGSAHLPRATRRIPTASTTAAASSGTGGSGRALDSAAAPTRGARGSKTWTVCPRAATLRTMDSMNGAVGSPSNRGYDEVIARIFTAGRVGSAQDVLDHALRALALADPLLVLRGDELGEQSKRDELDPDDHQEHAERQERSRPDALRPRTRSTVRYERMMNPIAPMSRPMPPKRWSGRYR